MGLKPVLTPSQLRGIKDHKYNAEGISIGDALLQAYWNWLVKLVPLWMAPNLITFTGFVVNIATSAPIIVADPNCMGKAPRWMYLLCAVGLFVYQSLDAIDGKQARRTKTNNPLGELFDHGCDAISTFFVVLAGSSAAGLNEYPSYYLAFVLIIEVLNYCYHWQTYVSGTLFFKRIDVTEGQFTHMAIMIGTFLFGPDIWRHTFPLLGVQIKPLLIFIVFGFSFLNFISAFVIILTKGKGKHGSTVADTSVLSPVIPATLLVGMAILCAVLSPGKMLETHSMLFMAAMTGPIVKIVLLMMIAGMSKCPLPLVDIVMLGPLAALINVFLNALLPEYYLLLFIVIFVTYDIFSTLVVVVMQVCRYLDVSCFTIQTTGSTIPTERQDNT